MRVLAVDTTSERGSVAVVEGGETLAELRLVSGAGHARKLLPAVDFLLKALETTLESIDGYAVAVGPGSFTGLRIGISTVQGLALGHPRPCLGVSALDALAARAAPFGGVVCAMVDAWRDEVYAALYEAPLGPVLEGPCAEPPAVLAKRLPAGAACIGSGALRYRAAITAANPRALFPERSLFLAGTLGRIAERRLLAGEGGGPELLRPLYVREATQ